MFRVLSVGDDAYSRSVTSSFAALLPARGIYYLCQWLTVLLLARLMGPDAVGLYALGLAVVTPLFLLGNLNLRSVQMADVTRRYPFRVYLSLRIVTCAALFVIIPGYLILANRTLDIVLTATSIVVVKGVEFLVEILHGEMLLQRSPAWIAWSHLIRGPILLVTVVLIAIQSHSLPLALCVSGIASFVIFLCLDWRIVRRFMPRNSQFVFPKAANTPLLRSLAWNSLPLGLASAINGLQPNVLRFLLDGSRGRRELGVYTALSTIPLAGNLVASALADSISPEYGALWRRGQLRPLIQSLVRSLLLVSVIGSIGLFVSILFNRAAVNMLFGPAYTAYAELLPWLIANGIAGYAIFFVNSAMVAMDLYRSQLMLNVGSFLIFLFLALPLLGRFGLKGAAIAYMTSSVIQVAVSVALTFTILVRRKSIPAGSDAISVCNV